jgi:hypothetical protein
MILRTQKSLKDELLDWAKSNEDEAAHCRGVAASARARAEQSDKDAAALEKRAAEYRALAEKS